LYKAVVAVVCYQMAAAMCNHAFRALSVDGGLQRRGACGTLPRRRFLGLPRVKTVSSSQFWISSLLYSYCRSYQQRHVRIQCESEWRSS
jgi:hypothetical protein